MFLRPPINFTVAGKLDREFSFGMRQIEMRNRFRHSQKSMDIVGLRK